MLNAEQKKISAEKRKLYLKEWRKRNREHCNKYTTEYLHRTGKKYYNKEKARAYIASLPKERRLKIKEYQRNRFHTKNPKSRLNFGLGGTSGLGRMYEKIALKLLPNSIDCNLISFQGKWDIEWEGLKIDVKMRNKSVKENGWHFTTKPNPVADYYLCFCVDCGSIIKILFIPKIIFKLGVFISVNSKHDKYRLILC